MRYSHGELVQLAEEGRRKKMGQIILNLKKLAEEAVDAELKRRDLVAVVRCKDCAFAEEMDSDWRICHNHNCDCERDAEWFCGDGTSKKGHWRVNPDRERANFICSECLEEVDECEERCPHCGIAMKWGEEDAEIH